MTGRSQGWTRTAVQQVFWILVTIAAYVALALPATICKLIFGSPS